jgi:hypothetical protein
MPTSCFRREYGLSRPRRQRRNSQSWLHVEVDSGSIVSVAEDAESADFVRSGLYVERDCGGRHIEHEFHGEGASRHTWLSLFRSAQRTVVRQEVKDRATNGLTPEQTRHD